MKSRVTLIALRATSTKQRKVSEDTELNAHTTKTKRLAKRSNSLHTKLLISNTRMV
jgi:hypothetical protein